MGRRSGTYAEKISSTGSKPKNRARNREERQPGDNVKLAEKEEGGNGKDKIVIID